MKAVARWLAPTAAALALAAASTGVARADIAYAFAEQTITNVAITPTVTFTTATSTSAQDSATINGSGTSASDPLDALQTFLGGTPAAPQNSFVRYATGNPPASPTTPPSFTRADALITTSGQGTGINSAAVVAESFLNTTTVGHPNTETGNSGDTASVSFTLSTATALSISYGFANDLFVFSTGVASASANYHFNITIKDGAGNVVFTSATGNTNLSLSAPPQGAEVIKSGSETVTTPVLSTGTTYTMSVSSTAQSEVTAVPEPASLALLGLGVLISLHFRRSFRRAD
jgi:hypothetical protein